MWSEVKASQRLRQVFFPAPRLAKFPMLLFRLCAGWFGTLFFLLRPKTYVKLTLVENFTKQRVIFKAWKFNFESIESENDDKSDQNSIESGSKSINETNEAKIAEFLLENQLKAFLHPKLQLRLVRYRQMNKKIERCHKINYLINYFISESHFTSQ